MLQNVIFHSGMSTIRPTRVNAVTLTLSALLGLGTLAGCGSTASSTALPSATAPVSPSAPTISATASSAPATMSASSLLSAALSSLRSAGSVHVDVTGALPGGSVTFSDDATATGGRQLVTFDGTGHATILLIGGVGYVQADAQTLAGFFDVPQAQAAQAAGQWISLQPGEKLGMSTYDDVTAGITLSSVAQEVQLTGPLTKTAPATVAGGPAIGVEATPPAADDMPAGAKMLLYITEHSPLRPVQSELVGGGSTKSETSFSQWGETLHLTAPANAVPASTITPVSSTA